MKPIVRIGFLTQESGKFGSSSLGISLRSSSVSKPMIHRYEAIGRLGGYEKIANKR